MSGGKTWTAEDDATLLAAWERFEGKVDLVAAAVGRPARSVTVRKFNLRRAGRWPEHLNFATVRRPAPLAIPGLTLARPLPRPFLAGPTLLEVLRPEESSPEPDAAFLERIMQRTDAEVRKYASMSYAKLRIVTDKPVGLSIFSDTHLTPRTATRVRAAFEYARTVAASDGIYALGVGDMTDMPVKHKPQAPGDVPDEIRLLDLFVGAFGGKLVAMTDGNHDAWFRQLVGLDHLKALAERHAIHYAPDELIYVVEIESPTTGEVTARWTIATRHKYRRHSALNITHACWRWLEEMANEWPRDEEGRTLLPDALCIGDSHVAGVEGRSYPRGDVWGVRMGAWQHSSGFSRGLGFPSYRPTAPVLVLPPTREAGIHAFADYAKGVDYLARVRA